MLHSIGKGKGITQGTSLGYQVPKYKGTHQRRRKGLERTLEDSPTSPQSGRHTLTSTEFLCSGLLTIPTPTQNLTSQAPLSSCCFSAQSPMGMRSYCTESSLLSREMENLPPFSHAFWSHTRHSPTCDRLNKAGMLTCGEGRGQWFPTPHPHQ